MHLHLRGARQHQRAERSKHQSKKKRNQDSGRGTARTTHRHNAAISVRCIKRYTGMRAPSTTLIGSRILTRLPPVERSVRGNCGGLVPAQNVAGWQPECTCLELILRPGVVAVGG